MTTEDPLHDAIGGAIGRIPSGLFILTARYEDRRTGMLVSWVQQVSFKPPMVCAVIGKGRPIMPLISESRQFGLCQLPKDDKILLRKFASGIDNNEDPFLGFDLLTNTRIGAPILAQSLSYLECEVATHIDVEGDHDLFVGRVISGAKLSDTEPFIHLRDSGFKY